MLSISYMFYLTCVHSNSDIYPQLVNLAPKDLGEWEKAKVAPKRKQLAKGKKPAAGEEKEEGEEEEDDEDSEDAADDGEEEGEDRNQEVYVPRPTAHPRGEASDVLEEPSRKRKATGTLSATAAAEKRTKKLKGAGTGAQPTLHQMGFIRSSTSQRFVLPILVPNFNYSDCTNFHSLSSQPPQDECSRKGQEGEAFSSGRSTNSGLNWPHNYSGESLSPRALRPSSSARSSSPIKSSVDQ